MIITVAGEHRLSRPPERATLSLRLAFEADEPAAAMQAVEHAAAALAEDLDTLHRADPSPITSATVQAPGTRSWRPWSQDGRQLPVRHEASVRATVTFQHIPALAAWASRWGARDGWSVESVDWTLTEEVRARLEADALAGAVADARRRAQVVAAAAGAGPVTMLDVADPGLLPGTVDPGSPGMELKARAMDVGGEGVEVSPADVEITVRLHARFEARLES